MLRSILGGFIHASLDYQAYGNCTERWFYLFVAFFTAGRFKMQGLSTLHMPEFTINLEMFSLPLCVYVCVWLMDSVVSPNKYQWRIL